MQSAKSRGSTRGVVGSCCRHQRGPPMQCQSSVEDRGAVIVVRDEWSVSNGSFNPTPTAHSNVRHRKIEIRPGTCGGGHKRVFLHLLSRF
ncbi:hypothetical protein BaRGS_00025442 [Batillaria attramentaria]|uniref:Uncharacterized protein n=1 Tax=Batillaria attramentaria TaxID=370345 RepID=A0ABD0K875_9CAEN